MSSSFAALKRMLGLPGPKKPARSRFFRPRFDTLEDRRLMAVFTVDDSFAVDNPARRQYNTIQEAVDAAATPVGSRPGDIVIVRPGLYEESVIVDKKITITGAFAPALPFLGRNPNPNDPSLNPSRASIVDPATGAGFTLQASNIVIQGFTVANFDASLDTQGFSIQGGRANKLLRNVVVDNTIGIALATDTSGSNTGAKNQTQLIGNVLHNNNTDGAAAGNGIYADAGIRNVLISGNRITEQLNSSMILISADVATTNSLVTISGNLIGNAVTGETGNTIIVANLVDSTIRGNVLRNINVVDPSDPSVVIGGSGIFFAGGSTRVSVIANNLQNGAFTGINVRFLPGDYNVDTPNSRLTIQSNIVNNFGDGGIRLRDGAFNNIVRANNVRGNGFGDTGDAFGSGIALEEAINNIVERNISNNNDADGFFADALSEGNTFRYNNALFNGEHDFHDDSVGAGTAGTANFYVSNNGRTQNRNGLARNARVTAPVFP